VNQPPCDRCQGGTDGIGGSAPTPEEAKYRAGMVEVYRCKNAVSTISLGSAYRVAPRLLIGRPIVMI
jgi:hypothetical protein